MWLIVINQTFPPGAYIFHTRDTLSLPARHNQSSLSSCRVALCSSPFWTSARTEIGRAGLRNLTFCIETPARVGGQLGFWGESSVTAHRRDRLLPLWRIEIDYCVFVFFLVDVCSAVVAVVFAMFISKLSSDKIAHVHIYTTTILCVIFWIKSNIKCIIF